ASGIAVACQRGENIRILVRVKGLEPETTYGVTVVAVTTGDGKYTPAFPETVLNEGNQIVVAGQVDPLNEFCKLA
ncbi:MAG: TrkA C-terminal domain-containing protein, partial [Aquiluna sp.]